MKTATSGATSPHQRELEVHHVGAGRPGAKQIAETVEEAVGVVAFEERVKIETEPSRTVRGDPPANRSPITTARTRNRFSSRMASSRRSEPSRSRASAGQALILALALSITDSRSPMAWLPSGNVFGGGLIFNRRSLRQSRCCFESCQHPVSIQNLLGA